MKIGILQAGHVPDEILHELGDYEAMFRKLLSGQGLEFDHFDVVDMEFPGSVTDRDGWLITGSRHGVYEDHAFIPPLEDFIRDAHTAGVPMVGICFGHQIIAQALGGRVEKFDGGWGVGRQTYTMNGEEVHLNAWHQDQVLDPPKGATVIAGNAFCENAALVYDNRAFTVQPHPEFEAAMIDGLATHRAPGVVPDELLVGVRDGLPLPTDSAKLAEMIGRFFKERRVA